MSDNVRALPGAQIPGDRTPVESCVRVLENLLARAKSGELRCFVATGFTVDGGRLGATAGRHDNVFEMLGAIAWLQQEYIHTAALSGPEQPG